MGAKTALLAFSDGDPHAALRNAARSDTADVIARVRELHPGYEVTSLGGGSLGDYVYPPEDTSYATVLPGAELFCDRRLFAGLPSRTPARLLRAGADRRVVMHGMHSMSDALCFAVWENGDLVRSLVLSPDGGVTENIGEPYEFELPYWAGERPVSSMWPGADDPYPLPFHPLELGDDALYALVGFSLARRRGPDDFDPFGVPLHGFGVADPSGREQAARQADMERLASRMRPPRRYRRMPDGTLREITDDES